MYAAASVFRNFQKKKKQNIVSGVRCMDSETTDQPVAGQNVCGSKTVFRNFQKTQKLVSGGWCLGSKETDQPVAGRAACMIKLVIH